MVTFSEGLKKFKQFKNQLDLIDRNWRVLHLKFGIDPSHKKIYVRAMLDNYKNEVHLNFDDLVNEQYFGWAKVTSTEISQNFELVGGLEQLFNFMIRYYLKECVVKDNTIFNIIKKHSMYTISYDPEESNNLSMYPFIIVCIGESSTIEIDSFRRIAENRHEILESVSKQYPNPIYITVKILNPKLVEIDEESESEKNSNIDDTEIVRFTYTPHDRYRLKDVMADDALIGISYVILDQLDKLANMTPNNTLKLVYCKNKLYVEVFANGYPFHYEIGTSNVDAKDDRVEYPMLEVIDMLLNWGVFYTEKEDNTTEEIIIHHINE